MKLLEANVTVMVDDLDRALSFYTGVLGLAPGAREGNYFAEVRAPGLTVVLHPRRPGVVARTSHVSLGLRVERIAEAAAHLRRLGVPFEEDENVTNRFLHFRDPDGTALYVLQPKESENTAER
jgi:catechol 2,3-dioxygenase-like lactoylglutathione lyase family enzyme